MMMIPATDPFPFACNSIDSLAYFLLHTHTHTHEHAPERRNGTRSNDTPLKPHISSLLLLDINHTN